jgi:hypothetical protein
MRVGWRMGNSVEKDLKTWMKPWNVDEKWSNYIIQKNIILRIDKRA